MLLVNENTAIDHFYLLCMKTYIKLFFYSIYFYIFQANRFLYLLRTEPLVNKIFALESEK